jgi:putative glutamine amidotransferase
MSRPIVVIPSCTKFIDGQSFDAVGRKYSSAVAEAAGCQPLLAPLGPSMADVGAVIDIADAILLSGSLSNVAPERYGSAEPPIKPDFLDPARDDLTLPLIRTAIEKKIPLFAICRGFQELNVALGGTLHQAVHAVDGFNDHREPASEDMDVKFSEVHPVALRGKLRDWIGRDEIMVNSLHGQGIARLADGLTPEAFAKDGLVEAVRGPEEHPFMVGVQWHPEWNAVSNPVSLSLFRRFGAAAGART